VTGITCNVRRATCYVRDVRRATCYVLALLAVACGVKADGPPEILVDRTPCAHCGMLVSEPAFAAAYRRDGSEARIFDDIGCLLNAISSEANPERLRFWFHDAGTAVWIDRTEAVFVRSARLRTPMSGGIVAYGGHAAAEKGAADHAAVVIGSFDQVLMNQRPR
jgi:copper chaperone NosL